MHLNLGHKLHQFIVRRNGIRVVLSESNSSNQIQDQLLYII